MSEGAIRQFPTLDGHDANKLSITLSGTVLLERTMEDGRATMDA